MARQGPWTKILAIVGTVLIWLALLGPLLFALVALVAEGVFRFDLFVSLGWLLVALIGGVLALWAAMRARLYRAMIGVSLGFAIAALAIGQAFAGVTQADVFGGGLPQGGEGVLMLIVLLVYIIALIVMGVGGIRLSRYLMEAEREVEIRL